MARTAAIAPDRQRAQAAAEVKIVVDLQAQCARAFSGRRAADAAHHDPVAARGKQADLPKRRGATPAHAHQRDKVKNGQFLGHTGVNVSGADWKNELNQKPALAAGINRN